MTGVGVKGRGEMIDGLQKGDQNFMAEVKNGFHDSQVDTAVLAEFDSCANDNQGRVYNIGRAILGLPPV